MGLFCKARPEVSRTRQVRPEQIARLAALIKAEDDAILFDASGSPDFARAKGLLKAALRNSSAAEIDAAYRAAYRDE